MGYKIFFLSVFQLLINNIVFAQSLPIIEKLMLVDAKTGASLKDSLLDGDTIYLKSLPSKKVNIIAIVNPKSVKKVDFYTNNAKKTSDSSAPFAYKGDNRGKLKAWVPSHGSINIKAIPLDKKTRKAGTGINVTIRFEDGWPPAPILLPLPQATLPVIVSPTPILESTPTPETSLAPSPIASEIPNETGIPPDIVTTPIPTLSPTPSSTTTTPISNSPISSPSPNKSPNHEPTAIRVTPEINGFGSQTSAGSGRHLNPPFTNIFKIHSLANNGTGSLRECVEYLYPRMCIFEVSGKINLTSPLEIKNPFITIAGQTAPVPGITLVGSGLRIKTHDVFVQHLRIRIGDSEIGPEASTRDGVVIWGTTNSPAYNVILDHLSVSWAIDENLSTYGNALSDITISNSLIAESLHNSIHPKGPHGKGMLVGLGSKNISIHHNIFAHNHDRNPRILPGASVEFINNLIYNWGGSSGWNVANLSDTDLTNIPVLLNFIGNIFKAGSNSTRVASVYAAPPARGSSIYTLDNLGPTRNNILENDWLISSLSENQYRALQPTFQLSNINPTSVLELETSLLQTAGARPSEQNIVDNRIKNEVRLGSGQHKDCLNGCSRAVGTIDTDISIYRPLVIPSQPFLDDNFNGYTNLEDWIWMFNREVE